MKLLDTFKQNLFSKEVILYIIFGIITTLINIGTSYILSTFCHLEGNISSTIGIICSILFAYFTNRNLVFNSAANTFKEKLFEFFKFIFGRLFTMILEIIGFYILFSMIGISLIISKITISIVVIILNFIISKFFAFKH